jgi:hypothetical protein
MANSVGMGFENLDGRYHFQCLDLTQTLRHEYHEVNVKNK